MSKQCLVAAVIFLLLTGCAKPMRTITSNPPGAMVFEDNRPIGTTPITSKEPPFNKKCWESWAYSAKLDGYKTATHYSSISCDDFTIHFTLEPLTTIKREIKSVPDGAIIYFGKDIKKLKSGAKDEIKLGQAPFRDQRNDNNSTDKPKWEVGYYRAVLSGYRPKVIEVNETDKDLKLEFSLAPLPKFPDPPKIVFPDPKDVIIQPVKLDDNRGQLADILSAAKFAIVPFKDPHGMGAGELIADILTLDLKKLGYKVVDREVIDKVLKEQNRMDSSNTDTEDKELAKKIGQIEKYDYLITGVINDYSAKSENVKISPDIPKEEKERYVAEYNEFADYYTKEVEEKEWPSRYPATIQQWEMEYASKPREHYLSIARIGLSSKMIKLESTKIVWIGFASTTDMSSQEGAKRVVDAMIKNFTTTNMPVGNKTGQIKHIGIESKNGTFLRSDH